MNLPDEPRDGRPPLAEQIEPLTGIGFDIVGFDTGEGLPQLHDYKDHPELWVQGDFAMANRDELIASLRGKARIEFGDIADTIGPFTTALGTDAPLGFISIDVDIYTGTVAAPRCLEREPECYLPVVGVYPDDCTGYVANEWCGELAAVQPLILRVWSDVATRQQRGVRATATGHRRRGPHWLRPRSLPPCGLPVGEHMAARHGSESKSIAFPLPSTTCLCRGRIRYLFGPRQPQSQGLPARHSAPDSRPRCSGNPFASESAEHFRSASRSGTAVSGD